MLHMETENWVDVLGNSSLRKKIINNGVEENKPLDGDIVEIFYKECLSQDKEVVHSANLSFVLGDGDVIPIFDLGLKLMNLNETSKFICASRFAYGKFGKEFRIPPNSEMMFDITLTSFKPAVDFKLLSGEDIISLCLTKKEIGNKWFQREEYMSAINSYSKGLKILNYICDTIENSNLEKIGCYGHVEANQTTSKSYIELYTALYNNMAAAQLKAEAYNACLKSLDEVFRYKPKEFKASYRKFQAHFRLGQYDEAMEVLKILSHTEPDNKVVRKDMKTLKKIMSKVNSDERLMYKKMLSGLGEPQNFPDSKSHNNTNRYFDKITDFANNLYHFFGNKMFTNHFLTVFWFAGLSVVLGVIGYKYTQWTIPNIPKNFESHQI